MRRYPHPLGILLRSTPQVPQTTAAACPGDPDCGCTHHPSYSVALALIMAWHEQSWVERYCSLAWRQSQQQNLRLVSHVVSGLGREASMYALTCGTVGHYFSSSTTYITDRQELVPYTDRQELVPYFVAHSDTIGTILHGSAQLCISHRLNSCQTAVDLMPSCHSLLVCRLLAACGDLGPHPSPSQELVNNTLSPCSPTTTQIVHAFYTSK